MRRLPATCALALLALLVTSCSPLSRPAPKKNEKLRIISLAPSLTEILFKLGAGEQVVGVTRYCDYPAEVRSKEKIGDFLHPNLEKIVSLNPDLIIAERWPSSRTVPRLKTFGLNVLELNSPASIDEIYHLVLSVGEAVQKAGTAKDIVQDMKQRVHIIQERAKGLTHQPSVYVEIDLPSWTIGKTSFITEALSLCGLKNLFADLERPALQVSRETIILRNPDVIISFTGAENISQRPGWDTIDAVKKGRIIDDLNQDLLSHSNHRLIEGMEEVQKRILAMYEEEE